MRRTKQTTFVLALAALTLALAACGGGAPPAPTDPPAPPAIVGDAANGATLFVTCSACHGPDGRGLPGLGKDMTTSEFIANSSDAELVAFITVGRPISDPANTTGVEMPPKGGNPNFTEQDLYDIVAHIRTLE